MAHDVDLAEIMERERLLLTPEVCASAERLDSLLDTAFTSVDPLGRLWDRPGIIAALTASADLGSSPVEDSEMSGRVLSPELVLLTYASYAGGRRARHTSLWRRHDAGWRLLHHQGTPITG